MCVRFEKQEAKKTYSVDFDLEGEDLQDLLLAGPKVVRVPCFLAQSRMVEKLKKAGILVEVIG